MLRAMFDVGYFPPNTLPVKCGRVAVRSPPLDQSSCAHLSLIPVLHAIDDEVSVF